MSGIYVELLQSLHFVWHSQTLTIGHAVIVALTAR